jgi:hypothetical protein
MRNLLMACGIAVFATMAVAEPVTAPVARSDAATDASNAQAPAAKSKPAKATPEKICKNLDVGFSHRTERVCMTPEQWEDYNRGE